MCRFSPSEECPDVSGPPQDDVSPDQDSMKTEHNFPLTFSNYIVADYKFRITDSHGSMESVCDDDASNAGINFIEYNLHFYRAPEMEDSDTNTLVGNVQDYSSSDSNGQQFEYDNGTYDDDNGTTVLESQQWR